MGSFNRAHLVFGQVTVLGTPELGDASYLVTHNGEAGLIDPQRDVDRFLAAAEAAGTTIRWVAETHMHNDYVSGARDLARRAGAELLLPAGAGAAFQHVPAFHLEEIIVGPFVIRPIHTPGHTPEHVSYLVLVDGEPIALFTGGSLLAGSVGRTDLAGEAHARQMARLQLGSVRRLAALPPDLDVYPTHGPGSSCSLPASGRAQSTIGFELSHNPALRAQPTEVLVDELTANLPPYPAYYRHMAPINRLQAAAFPPRAAPELSPEMLAPEVRVIDMRPRHLYAAGHLPGSLNIEWRNSFATWVGWLVPFDAPIALVIEEGTDPTEVLVALARIGYDRVIGVARGLRTERPLSSNRVVSSADLAAAITSGEARQVLDVRTPAEWSTWHLPESIHLFAPEVAARAASMLDRRQPVWVACATGYRAATVVGTLEQLGFEAVLVEAGGIEDLRELSSQSAIRVS